MGERLGKAEQGPIGDPGGDAHDLDAVVRAAIVGDERAWIELLDLYTPRIFAMARSRLRDDDMAEEITQSVFVTVAEKLRGGGYNDQGRFEPWLFRIAMNRVRDEIRRRSRAYVGADTDAIERAPGASSQKPSLDAEGPNARLKHAVAGLSDADQEIISLRHQAQMSFKEIAAMLDEPVGTLLARHHRALRKLRGMLDPLGKETA